MNWGTSKTLIIAHRGNTGAAIENTLPAIESAIQLGVDGVEVDLQLTSDGRVIVFHDWDLRRLAGQDRLIEKSTLDELRAVRSGNVTIPTLEELLDLVKARCLINLELKTLCYFRGDLERKVVQILRSFPHQDLLLISSFNPFALRRMKHLAPHLLRGYLFEDKPLLHRWIQPWVSPFSINAPLSETHRALVERAHRDGRRFFVWTVNHENDMKELIRMGVDGIITDHPKGLLKLRDELIHE